MTGDPDLWIDKATGRVKRQDRFGNIIEMTVAEAHHLHAGLATLLGMKAGDAGQVVRITATVAPHQPIDAEASYGMWLRLPGSAP